MSGTATLAILRESAKDRADMVNSKLVSDPRWLSYINSSKDELYDLLISAYGEDYYTKSDTISLVSGTHSYSLPSDFYKLAGVDLKVDSSRYVSLKKYEFAHRNRYDNNASYYVSGINVRYRYHLLSDEIYFEPIPESTETIRLWYVPIATNLAADSDTIKGFNGWEEYIIVSAAIKALRKEESPTLDLERDLARINERLIKMRYNRDISDGGKIVDISPDDNYGYQITLES